LCRTKPDNLRPNVISLTCGGSRHSYQAVGPHLGPPNIGNDFCWENFAMRSVLHLVVFSIFMMTAFVPVKPMLAQKLVDPSVVAPEFREAAEKRRAEQVKMIRCQRKAEEAKVLPRDRTMHINHCLQTETGK